MNRSLCLSGGFLLVALVSAGLVVTSCSSVKRTIVSPPEIEGASFVGNKACADCHGNITRAFPGSPHARFYKDDPKWAGKTGCESCHGAGSKHIAAGGGRGRFILNPGHDPAICFQCHFDVEAELKLPNHHPVVEGRMNCVQCHDPHGHDIFKPGSGLAMARLNQSCATCHRDQSRPFVFEHEAMWEGCTICHTPHGSINRKLLIQRDNNLCLRCHSQLQGQEGPGALLIGKFDHSSFIRGRTCWSAGCHPAVHGSNISGKFHY
jgi:predicted CXXCH cytochrome family protein